MSEKNFVKDSIKKIIDDNRAKIKSSAPKDALKKDPQLLIRTKNIDKVKIDFLLEGLESRCKELKQYIHRLKTNIIDINEETLINACYLLLCYNMRIWESLFILAREGYYSEFLSLIRNVKENSILIQHLILENVEQRSDDLRKWFEGNIITHGEARESSNKYLSDNDKDNQYDYKSLQTSIYRMESLSVHQTYVSILEAISPFTEDFDFEGYVQTRRMLSALRYANGALTDVNTSLKMIFKYVWNDPQAYKELDEIMCRYDPTMKETLDDEAMKDFKTNPNTHPQHS